MVVIILKQIVAGVLTIALAALSSGCNREEISLIEFEPPPLELEDTVEFELPSAELEDEGEIIFTKPWQNAYVEFLQDSENYIEDGLYARGFVLADLNNDGVPELL